MAADESPWYLGAAKVKEEQTETGAWKVTSESDGECVVWSRQPFLRFGQKRLLVISTYNPNARPGAGSRLKGIPHIMFSYPGVALAGFLANTGPPNVPQASPQAKIVGEQGATCCGFWPSGVAFRYVGPDSKPGGSAITIEWPCDRKEVESVAIFADGSEHTKADGLWFQAVNTVTKKATPLIKPLNKGHKPSVLWPPASPESGLHIAVVLPKRGSAITLTVIQDVKPEGKFDDLWGYAPPAPVPSAEAGNEETPMEEN
jgi:hypothetical protein